MVTTLRRPNAAEFQPGMVLESRDQQYEPGRRVRLISGDGHGGATRWVAETTANPSRPDRVGTRTTISQKTLRSRWGIPTTSEATP